MFEATLQQVAVLCGGIIVNTEYNDSQIIGVSTHSQHIVARELFIPLQGARFDGHQYVAQAFQAGASAALWQADHKCIPVQYPLIVVENTYQALQQLATAYINQLSVKVVAITGSNGKTTTKDMIAAALAQRYRVHKTAGNYNNHIGLPLTILSMPKNTDIVVLEMGMSDRGEIERLSSIAKPHIAIVTNVGEAHLLQLGSRTEIARAKLEIIRYLQLDGTLIFYGDEPLLEQILLEQTNMERRLMSIIRFGETARCDVCLQHFSSDDSGSTFTLTSTQPLNQLTLRLPLLGKHNVINALAAIAVAQLFHISAAQIVNALENVKISGMRFERIVTAAGWILLNDAYNASPTSMKAALAVLANLRTGKRIAILGDMLELGPDEATLHYEVGMSIKPESLDLLLTYGQLGEKIALGALQHMKPQAVFICKDKAQLKACLLQHVMSGDTVLIKASRGMKFEEIVNDWIYDRD